MTTDALPAQNQPFSDWHLLAEFLDDGTPGSQVQLLLHINGALQSLNLQPQQLKRIERLFLRAGASAARTEEPAPPSFTHGRIWYLRTCADDCGWGFFVVETKGQAPGSSAADTGRLVQLFLYQERDS